MIKKVLIAILLFAGIASAQTKATQPLATTAPAMVFVDEDGKSKYYNPYVSYGDSTFTADTLGQADSLGYCNANKRFFRIKCFVIDTLANASGTLYDSLMFASIDPNTNLPIPVAVKDITSGNNYSGGIMLLPATANGTLSAPTTTVVRVYEIQENWPHKIRIRRANTERIDRKTIFYFVGNN
jgi:hypothetical protein